jgi:hypothetical protein
MAGNRTLKLSILADVDDLKKKLGQGEKEVKGFGDKLGEFGKKAAVAFTVAAAAAAAYAGKLLVDGVKAAIEDEKANAKLAATLKNVTGATNNQIDSVLAYTRATELATGVTEDELRPSLNRLAIATGDVKKATDLQKIALDVAAGSGKGLEAVSQALAKAYEGNTASLGRLGIGLSSAKLSTMSFEEITKSLSETFKGQADVAANTLQGRMDRLRLAFEDVRDTVGEKLLPIIEKIVNFFLNDAGPAVDGIRRKFEPLTKALKDNKDEFTAIWNFLNKYIVPILTGALKGAVNGIVTTFTTLVNIVGKAVNFFQDLYAAYKKFVDFIKNNPLSKFLGNLNPFSNSSFTTGTNLTSGVANADFSTSSTGQGAFDSEGDIVDSPGLGRRDISGLTELQQKAVRRSIELQRETAEIRARIAARNAGNSLDTTNNGITINVNSPSVIDEEGFARAVVGALNLSTNRGTTGLADLRESAAIV